MVEQDLDRQAGPVQVLSVCKRRRSTVIDALASRDEAPRVQSVLREWTRSPGPAPLPIHRADSVHLCCHRHRHYVVPADVVLLHRLRDGPDCWERNVRVSSGLVRLGAVVRRTDVFVKRGSGVLMCGRVRFAGRSAGRSRSDGRGRGGPCRR